MSPATAKTHVVRILSKLHARDRAQLVVAGLRDRAGHARRLSAPPGVGVCTGGCRRDRTRRPTTAAVVPHVDGMDAMDAIAVEHLTKRYRDVVAVDDLSFAIPPGRITGFLGRTAPARPRPCGRCSASSARPRARRLRRRPLRRAGRTRPHRRCRPRRRRSTPPAAPATTSASSPPPAACRRRGSTTSSASSISRAPPTGGSGLLPRHAPAPRARRPPSSAIPRSSCSTSRPTGSTPTACAGCATCCAGSPPRAAPSSSPATSSPRWPRPSTRSS